MKSTFIVYTLAFALCCCQSPHKTATDIETITLNTQTASNQIDISPFIDANIDIVKLETTETCLVRADAVKLLTEKYILIGDNVSKQIFMFDRQGKFIRTIGKIGRGPGEYVDLYGFYYRKDSLYIHDRIQTKLISYSIADSGFQERQILPPIYSSSITGSNDVLHFITNYSNAFNLISLNLNDGRQTYRLPYDTNISKNKSWWDLNQYCANYKDSVLFILSRNDTIYQILGDTILPKYFVDFPMNKLPEVLLQKSGSKILKTALDKGYICGLDRIFQTSQYIMGEFGEGCKNFQFLFDKINGKTILAESFVIEDWGGLSIINPITTNNDELICFYDALLFKEYGNYIVEKKSFQKDSDREQLHRLLSSINEDDNPIMVIMKFK